MLKMIMMILIMFFFMKMYWFSINMIMYIYIMFLLLFIPSMNNFYYFIFWLDLMSFGLILLTIWIMILLILSSKYIFFINYYIKEFLITIFFLMFILILCFSISNLLLFYLFFEMSLIPTLFLILGWGYQPERIQASLYMLMYTIFFSMPLLMVIFFSNNIFYSINFIFLMWNMMMMNVLFYLSFTLAFLVKLPMFLLHLWLPKAHVEAPISGSMILAGVLLKLGGYGLLRILFFICLINNIFSYYWIMISLLGMMMISFICLLQKDFKLLIAYSSVVHMSLITASIFNYSAWSFNSSYLMMICHGVCSSGMFYMSNLYYERIHSRSMLISKGNLNLMPSLTLWWFLILSSNMAAPPSLNLLSEISLFNSILNWSNLSCLMLMIMSFMSACYCLYLFSYSQHGNINSMMYCFSSISILELLILMLHWLPLNFLILKSEFFMLWL